MKTIQLFLIAIFFISFTNTIAQEKQNDATLKETTEWINKYGLPNPEINRDYSKDFYWLIDDSDRCSCFIIQETSITEKKSIQTKSIKNRTYKRSLLFVPRRGYVIRFCRIC